MKKNRHTPEQQIVRKLREAQARLCAGTSVPQVPRESWGSAKPPSTSSEESATGDAHGGHKMPEGAGEGKRPPEEDRCRASHGHQHPQQGGEPGKLL